MGGYFFSNEAAAHKELFDNSFEESNAEDENKIDRKGIESVLFDDSDDSDEDNGENTLSKRIKELGPSLRTTETEKELFGESSDGSNSGLSQSTKRSNSDLIVTGDGNCQPIKKRKIFCEDSD